MTETLRRVAFSFAVGGFAGLGLEDLIQGRDTTGRASMFLATANSTLLR